MNTSMALIAEKRQKLDKMDKDKSVENLILLSQEYSEYANNQIAGNINEIEPSVFVSYKDSWNPSKDVIQNLIHAAALLSAAIDKLQTNDR